MAPRRRVTIADIAKMAGVSRGAVSFALNGRPGVSDETRDRIIRIAQELEWQPSRAARTLGGARTGVIGLVVERPARSLGMEAFFADLISGIQAELAQTDVALQLRVVTDGASEIRTYRAWHGSGQVDGVVLLDPRDEDPRLAVLAELGMPCIVLGSTPDPVPGASAVWIDDERAAHALFDYIAALGHSRIAYIAGPEVYQHTRIRVSVLESLVERGVTTEACFTDFSPRAATDHTRRLLSARARPTAIVYDNEAMAIAGLRVAQTMRVTVPDALSIASFDDSVISEHIHPSITSLTRDTFELGRVAARRLLEQLDEDDTLPNLPGPFPELSVRESTAPPA